MVEPLHFDQPAPDQSVAVCKCFHLQTQHVGFYAEEPGKGRCTIEGCKCEKFTLLEGARALRAPILDPDAAWKAKPKHGWFIHWFRRWIGLADDVDKGEMFEKLVVSNFRHQGLLIRGLRQDFDAANDTQNPVNVLVAELQQRLSFYEQHNDSLQPSWRKYLREQERTRKAAEREAAKQAREAAKKELQNHAPQGELIDCRECGGAGVITHEGRGGALSEITCPTCNGSGVELNPNYVNDGVLVPPTEEPNASDETVTGPKLVP